MKKIFNKYKNMNPGVKASFWFLICSLFQKGVSFFTIPIFTRILSPEEYGVYSIYLTWENILSIFATLNLSYQVFNNGMIKFSNEKDSYTTSMVGLTFVSSIICMCFLLLFNKVIFELAGLNILLILLMILDTFLISVISLLTVRERYDFKYKLIVIITLLSIVLNPVLGVMFVLTFKNKVLGRIVSVVIVNLIFGLIALFILLKRSNKIVNIKQWKFALKLDLPLIPHYLSLILLNSSDRIMIGEICGNSYAAFYSVAYNAAMIISILINSINSSFNPWIYKKLKDKDYFSIQKYSNYLLLFISILSILPMFFGPEIISILGDKEYYGASYIMSIISASVFASYLYSLFISVEMFYEKSKLITYGSILATVLNIGLNLIFLRKFGYVAAAYTTLVSYLLLAFFHYYNTKKIMRDNNIKTIFNVSVIIITTFVVVVSSILIQLLYKHFIIRYVLFLIIILLIIKNKKNILLVFKRLKGNE